MVLCVSFWTLRGITRCYLRVAIAVQWIFLFQPLDNKAGSLLEEVSAFCSVWLNRQHLSYSRLCGRSAALCCCSLERFFSVLVDGLVGVLTGKGLHMHMHVWILGPWVGLDCNYYRIAAWGEQILWNVFLYKYILHSRSKLLFLDRWIISSKNGLMCKYLTASQFDLVPTCPLVQSI